MEYKIELEKDHQNLTNIFTTMLQDLQISTKKINELEEELKKEKNSRDGFILILNSIKIRLEEETKALNKIYANEEYEPLKKYNFDFSVLKIENENPKPKQKRCVCGSHDLYLDADNKVHCKNCELV